MLNQSPTEAQNSAEFLKSYLECVEELPVDVIKTKSLILELDIKSSNIINETEELTEKIISSNGEMKKKFTSRLLEVLIQLQEIKSEKLHYSQIINEKVESKARAVLLGFKNDISINKTEESATTIKSNTMINQLLISQLPLKTSSKPASSASSSASDTNNNNNNNNNSSGNDRGGGIKRLRRATRLDTELERAETPKPVKIENPPNTIKEKTVSQQPSTTANKKVPATTNSVVNLNNVSGGNGNSKKKIKKKKKALSSSSSKQSSIQSVQELVSIEDENEDEETYCICEQVSYGEMILCENDACKIEWFHFSCVSLTSKPKGRWYCPSCRGDRPNVLNKTLRKKS